ncbi:MAG: ATP-binding protein [Gammaproteobacteria bacterium]|nr:ATP-binding protein [Gammaproteobacteria bacterium]
MHSLQNRLGSGLIISLLLAFSALWFVVSEGVQFLAEEYIASRLQHDAESLLSQLKQDKSGVLKLSDSQIDSVYTKPFSGHYYQINIEKQIIKSRSLWDSLLQAVSVETGQQLRSYHAGPNQQQLLVMHYGFEKQGKTIQIHIAEDLNPVTASIREFNIRFAITALLMLMVLVIVQMFIMRRSLKTLRIIRDELSQLQEGKISQLSRCPLIELHPLVDEINHMLTNMSQRLRRSRGSLGDLAHSIKRPLTVIQQHIEQAENVPVELRNSMLEQLSDINQLTERTLKRASLAGDQHGVTRFSFSTDVDALIKTLELMYSTSNVHIDQKVDSDISYHIDRQDMLELLGNLLDNACKWANSRVMLSISQNGALNICVEDDGPGIDQTDKEQLAKRGSRLDESKPGYGLGLGIATDIVEEYGGTIHYSRSQELGGFKVDISLSETR